MLVSKKGEKPQERCYISLDYMGLRGCTLYTGLEAYGALGRERRRIFLLEPGRHGSDRVIYVDEGTWSKRSQVEMRDVQPVISIEVAT